MRNTPAFVRLLMLALACGCGGVHAFPIYTRFLLSEGSYVNYDATGATITESVFTAFYDQHGNAVRFTSADFISSEFFGYEWRSYSTNLHYFTNGVSFTVLDSITLSNGYPFLIEHGSSTSFFISQNAFTNFVHRTATGADGIAAETITSTISDWSSDYRRTSTQVRTVDGELLSWQFNSWTNDPAHLQDFSWYLAGDEDEATPYSIQKLTNTFDSLGNLIFNISYSQFFESISVFWTSNSYLIHNKKSELLSSTSQRDFYSDGVIDFTEISTFSYDKRGNLAGRESKSFGTDGTLGGQTVSVFTYDQFGNQEYEETKYLYPDGALISGYIFTNTYVPRGKSFDRPPTTQLFPAGPGKDWLPDQQGARTRNPLFQR